MKRLVCFLVSLCSIAAMAQSPTLVRYPAISPNGSLLSFSFQGDIWTVPTTGGKASRLTVHDAYESTPVFSPDGKSIAFTGSRYGNNDIFVMPAEGGTPKRLTYHSNGDQISSWSNNNQIFFSTSREFQQIERPLEIYSISADGGTEVRAMMQWALTLPHHRTVASLPLHVAI